MTTCPGHVIDRLGRIDACLDCLRGEPHGMGYRQYVCLTCGFSSRRERPPVCCGVQTALAIEVMIPCLKCGRMFQRAHSKQAACLNCTPQTTVRSRRKRARLKPVEVAPQLGPIRCAKCMHGAASRFAESGWECSIQVAGRCGPWGPARFFKEKE